MMPEKKTAVSRRDGTLPSASLCSAGNLPARFPVGSDAHIAPPFPVGTAPCRPRPSVAPALSRLNELRPAAHDLPCGA